MQGWALILFVLWIGVSNLAIGFALAIGMGHGPRRWPRLSGVRLPKLGIPKLKLRLPSLRKAKKDAEETPPAEAAAESANAPDEAQEPAAPKQPAAATEKNNTPVVEMKSPAPAPESPAKEVSALDDGLPLDEALALFQREVAQVRGDLNDAQARVEQCADSPTVEAIEECVADLKDAGIRMLDKQAQSLQVIETSSDGSQASEQAVAGMQQAASTQATQIKQTLEEIDQFEVHPESLTEDCQRLKEHTESLTTTCDAIGELVAAAQSQAKGEAPTATTEGKVDEETVPPQLEQMEASEALHDWWADDPDHQRPLTMVMIDIDRVGKLNAALGNERVDALLHSVEELILAASTAGGSASQINPQRFLLMLPNTKTQQSTQMVEQLREKITALPVDDDHPELRLTASFAVAVARGGDTARTLVSRAESALAEAKQFGGNRTFLNEGEFPTPVSSGASLQSTLAS